MSPPPQARCACTGCPVMHLVVPVPCPHFSLLRGSEIDFPRLTADLIIPLLKSLRGLCTWEEAQPFAGACRALQGTGLGPGSSAHRRRLRPAAASRRPSGRAPRHSLSPRRASALSGVPRRLAGVSEGLPLPTSRPPGRLRPSPRLLLSSELPSSALPLRSDGPCFLLTVSLLAPSA